MFVAEMEYWIDKFPDKVAFLRVARVLVISSTTCSLCEFLVIPGCMMPYSRYGVDCWCF